MRGYSEYIASHNIMVTEMSPFWQLLTRESCKANFEFKIVTKKHFVNFRISRVWICLVYWGTLQVNSLSVISCVCCPWQNKSILMIPDDFNSLSSVGGCAVWISLVSTSSQLPSSQPFASTIAVGEQSHIFSILIQYCTSMMYHT